MLTSKQRSYLISLGVSLDPVVQAGRAGITPEAVRSLDEAFHNRELLKVNIQKNCPEDPRTAADMLAERTHAEVVKVTGRKAVLYRRDKDNPRIELPR